ncbi:MAG: hypothetical protein U0326_17480 [Polyangiales bacterium]
MTRPDTPSLPRRISLVRGLAWALCVVAASCSLTNRIDVCEQPTVAAHEVNLRTDGSQALDGVGSLAALPDQGAFIAFTSAVSNDDDGTGPASIRGAVLDGAGHPLRTCSNDGEAEYEPAGAAGTRADQPSVAMPSVTGEDTGLVVWRARDAAGQRVRGRFVTRAGCAMAPAFTVSTSDVTRVERPSVAWLGARRFVVTWTSVVGVATLRGMARVVAYQISLTPDFPATELAPDGAAAGLVVAGNGASYLRATALSGGRFLAAWYDPIALRPSVAVFDDRLHAAVAARVVSDVPPRTGALLGSRGATTSPSRATAPSSSARGRRPTRATHAVSERASSRPKATRCGHPSRRRASRFC